MLFCIDLKYFNLIRNTSQIFHRIAKKTDLYFQSFKILLKMCHVSEFAEYAEIIFPF